MNNTIWLIPLLPLLGSIIIGLFGRSLNKKAISFIGCGTILVSFIIVLTLLFPFLAGTGISGSTTPIDWIVTGNINISFSLLIDELSVMMMTIITGVGFLIHVYSAGYMHEDEGFARYFCYLNLFVFSMLILVMGDNYLLMFAGWEGVGLCSYLLIGFWFKKTEYNNAAKKAFIMNRIGDLGFLLGMLLILFHFGSLNFQMVMDQAPKMLQYNGPVVFAITILLFIGAAGKSAQIPLYTWLPDAMAGPTPVSALIHAATMVTAGIYMIVRSNPLYAMAPDTLEIISIIGLTTAIFAALIALVQNDIKKVLAYSTVSQLGYMFFALGMGAYSAAMFHLTTHAFFKALLFLGAGSVIHAMSNEQDIRKMGGLKKSMPVTHITFLIATLAISGIPPFAGFFSKDMILAHAWEHSPILWGLALAGALLTAFYMFRLYFLTFHGTFRGTSDQAAHLHESPLSMTAPLMVLAVLSVVGGFIGVPHALFGNDAISGYLSGIIGPPVPVAEDHISLERMLMAVSVLAVASVLFYAYNTYFKKGIIPLEDGKETASSHKVLSNKFYIDEIYNSLFVKPVHWLSDKIYAFMEIKMIDNFVNSWGRNIQRGSAGLKLIQNGSISFYLFAMVVGIILVLVLGGYGEIIGRFF